MVLRTLEYVSNGMKVNLTFMLGESTKTPGA